MKTASVSDNYRTTEAYRRFASHDAVLRKKLAERDARIDAEVEAAAARGQAAAAERLANGLRVPPGCRYSQMDRRPHLQPQHWDGRPVLVGDPRRHRPAPGGVDRGFRGGTTGTSAVDSAMARCAKMTRGLC